MQNHIRYYFFSLQATDSFLEHERIFTVGFFAKNINS